MANNITEIIRNAKELIEGNYFYIYGMKGQAITKEIINILIKRYPDVYTISMIRDANSKVGKGKGIDCSGFVCKACGIPSIGSSQIYSQSKNKWSIDDLSHIRNGMFVWVKGHIGLVEVDSKGNMWILESCLSKGLIRSKFESRKKIFTHYGEIPGVNYSDDWVARLQKELNKNGYLDKDKQKLKVDNIAGNLTLSACPTRQYRTYLDPITKLIQERLTKLGYYSDAITGNWGTKTDKAVANFQKKEMGIKKPNKICDHNMWAKLLCLK